VPFPLNAVLLIRMMFAFSCNQARNIREKGGETMFNAIGQFFQRLFRIRQAVQDVSQAVQDVGTAVESVQNITKQGNLKDAAQATLQAAQDAGTASGSVQEATKS
jgi:uncharacterized protein YoxC